MPGNSIQISDRFDRVNAGSDFPLFNGLFHFNYHEGQFLEKLKEHEKYFAPNPFTYWLHEYSKTKEIEKQLTSNGYMHGGEYHGMLFTFTDENVDTLHQIRYDHVDVRPVYTILEAKLMAKSYIEKLGFKLAYCLNPFFGPFPK